MSDPVSAPVASESQVRQLAQDWLRKKAPAGQVLAIHARPQWTTSERLEIDGHTVRVAACPSPVAVRAAIVDRAPEERLVILTDCDEDALGIGLLAHCAKLRPVSVDPWELVRAMFGTKDLDPALTAAGRWVGEALVEHAPDQGWTPITAAVLTRDHAMRSLSAVLLGVATSDLDGAGILQWTATRSVDVVRYAALPPKLREGIATWLAETGGPTARWAMACVDAGNGTDAIPLGLLAHLLWADGIPPTPTVTAAGVRVEHRLGGTQPNAAEATAWGDAARAWLERVEETDEQSGRQLVNQVLGRAEEIAVAIRAESLLPRSDLLPTALTARLRALADRLRAAVARPRAGELSAVETALREVRRHRLAESPYGSPGSQRERVVRAEMAVRLLRWLAAPQLPEPTTLAEAMARYVIDEGWVDRARLDVWAGDRDPHIGGAYRALLAAVDARRQVTDKRFATLLAQATAADSTPGSMLRVEDVITRVVRPLLDARRRVLLLVVDGMGVAASTELVQSMTEQGWIELTPDGGRRVGVLAALPTVTRVSRASLFAGRIAVGQQLEERASLTAALGAGVQLLHKADLRAGGGASLDPSVIASLEDPETRVVAAVVNTIDDALERSEPGETRWTTQTVRVVADLLAHAKDRVVVMLSDHGHIVDRGTEMELRSYPDGGARWRTTGDPAGEGEVEFTGPRVGLGDGRVVLPWRETLRYAPRKAGYHGGASPAEAVIPLTVLSAMGDTVAPGWAGAPVASPLWWRGPVSSASVTTAPTGDLLFDVVAAAPDLEPGDAPPAPPLVTALLASETFIQRHKLVGRTTLPPERVEALLSALVRAGGKAHLDSLAAEAAIPAHRIRLTLTALRRLLQVEGYPVLDLDPDGQTVVLDTRLLADQFHLGSP